MKSKMAVLTMVATVWAGMALAVDQPPMGTHPGGHQPPPQAFEDCKGKTAGDAVQHKTPQGMVAATCVESPQGLVARPNQRSPRREGVEMPLQTPAQ